MHTVVNIKVCEERNRRNRDDDGSRGSDGVESMLGAGGRGFMLGEEGRRMRGGVGEDNIAGGSSMS